MYKTFCILIHHFRLLHLPLYTHTHTHTHTPTQSFVLSHIKYTQTKNDVIYLQSLDDIYLALTLLFHLILTRMSWLEPPLHIVLRVIPYQIYTDQKRCHLPSIFGQYLFSSNIIVSFNLNPYELARTKEGELAFYIEWQ